jgi:hypothetical protein
MKKAVVTLILVLGLVFFAKAQSSINDYKYVIVPTKFDFLKSQDQYQLNSLAKFLFDKYGLTALMESDGYPKDLVSNYCLALKSNVLKSGGMFKTKLKVELRNCNNEIIFTSEIGETKEKDFMKAYALALRSAFKSFESIDYNYKPNKNSIAESNKISNSSTQEIEKLKEEIEALKEGKTSGATVVVGFEEAKPKADKVSEVEIQEHQTVKGSNALYAQEIDNGFQVVDSTPKIVMILFTTPKQNVFIVKGKDAIVYKDDGFWFISENKGKTTSTETLDIKF